MREWPNKSQQEIAEQVGCSIDTASRYQKQLSDIGKLTLPAKRLERGDVRKAVEIALREWPNKSQQEIAEQVGCTKQYVGQLKAEISKQVYLPPTRTDSMGRTRPTSYATKTPTSATFNPVLDGGGAHVSNSARGHPGGHPTGHPGGPDRDRMQSQCDRMTVRGSGHDAPAWSEPGEDQDVPEVQPPE